MNNRNHLNLLPGPWNDWPLQRIFPFITALVLIFLSLVMALGMRQYLLYNQCRQAVAAGDRLLFQFTSIKDHLNESLVLVENVNLRELGDELPLLEKELVHLTDNILVPEGLKARLPARVDLIGLEVQLRAIQEHRKEKGQETVDLVRALGRINIGLQQFRFGLGDHTQQILLGLHKIIVGALGLIVALCCSLLFWLNRSLTGPILDLCRLSGVEEEPCSLNRLHAQIERLRQGVVAMQSAAATVEPDDLTRQAHRYRCAVLGLVGTELASELTNRLNGILNYTQTLIDVEGKTQGSQMRADILPILLHEEKKAAELVGTLHRVGQWQPQRPSSIPLQRICGQLAQLLEKSLRAETISLELPADNRCEVLIPAGDLWLVLLSLIDQARRAILHQANSNRAGQLIRLSVETGGQGERLCLLLSNSAGCWLEGDPLLWPVRSFCTRLLQHHGAGLVEQTRDGQVLLQLDLPCRVSVA